MGAVVSCVETIFRSIGACLMAIVNGIGSILQAIIAGVVSILDVLIACLTCGYCGNRGRARRTGHRHGGMHTSRI